MPAADDGPPRRLAGWPNTPDIALVVDCRHILGESPVWDAETGELLWVDIHDGEIWRYRAADQALFTHVLPERVGAVGLAADGGYVLALASGFARFEPRRGQLQRIADVEAELPTTRLNDGRVDRQGRFVCGGMDEAVDQRPLSAVYRLDGDGAMHRLIEGVHCANSICFSLDGATMYFTDMPTRQILAYAYDVETGQAHSPRLFADCSNQPGLPDGSTVDAEGCVWNAQWGGGRLVRYAPDGRVDRVVPVPVTNPTSLAFGGEGLATLYVTSARFGLTAAQLANEPTAGGLFALRPGVSGVIEPRFVQ
jgi:L-arabinonolactonase